MPYVLPCMLSPNLSPTLSTDFIRPVGSYRFLSDVYMIICTQKEGVLQGHRYIRATATPKHYTRSEAAGLNPPAQRAGLFILIGAAGQLSSAFQILGNAAQTYFQQYKPQATSATLWDQRAGAGIDYSGMLFGLILLGFDYFTFCLAVVGVADVFIKKQFSYTLTWWSIVFPTVTLVTAWLQLGTSMDLPAFRGLTAALYMFVVVVYVLNWIGTIRGIVTGDLIWAKSELQREEGMMKKAKGMEKTRDSGEV